jgi:N-acetylglucosamine kinase-like BadF-type ATPase
MPEAQPPLIAGFDAGQTHTTCRLAALRSDGSWQALAEGQGSGVTHLAAAGGAERFQQALRSSLTGALAAAQLDPTTSLKAAGIGASGIEAGNPVQREATALAAQSLQLAGEHAVVVGDERTALAGAFGGGAGVLVISGTGCIAVGCNGQGQMHRCGGWGWLLDGAGSAMDIGRDGLAVSVQMADGRLANSALRSALWQALGADSAQAVKAAVVAPGFGAAGFALMVHSVAAQLHLAQPGVCGVGGALRHLQQLQQGFRAALQQRLPAATLQEPAGDACSGALSLAAQAAIKPR